MARASSTFFFLFLRASFITPPPTEKGKRQSDRDRTAVNAKKTNWGLASSLLACIDVLLLLLDLYRVVWDMEETAGGHNFLTFLFFFFKKREEWNRKILALFRLEFCLGGGGWGCSGVLSDSHPLLCNASHEMLFFDASLTWWLSSVSSRHSQHIFGSVAGV